MSLNGIKAVAKLIDSMEQTQEQLRQEYISNPNGKSGQQDDRLRAIVHCKLAELQDEVESVLSGTPDKTTAG